MIHSLCKLSIDAYSFFFKETPAADMACFNLSTKFSGLRRLTFDDVADEEVDEDRDEERDLLLDLNFFLEFLSFLGGVLDLDRE